MKKQIDASGFTGRTEDAVSFRRRIFCVSAGFTLVELMITIGVIAVLAAWALPNFQKLRQDTQVSAYSTDLFSDLQFAKSEATRRSRDVLFEVSANNGGWAAETWRKHEKLIDVNLTEIAGGATVVFTARGLAKQNFQVTLQHQKDMTGDTLRCLQVLKNGRISVHRYSCPTLP
ncbi:MAG: GspH/FimT family pseudopilin [Zoogloeaceae bacterium]|jgi:prepilin-type N-terminal cleavage/methylation domain-containing protein|nr:GspH/FimT family pseudopilin [Zoogloeaceae bacterium]